jgi:hypothetical protein
MPLRSNRKTPRWIICLEKFLCWHRRPAWAEIGGTLFPQMAGGDARPTNFSLFKGVTKSHERLRRRKSSTRRRSSGVSTSRVSPVVSTT